MAQRGSSRAASTGVQRRGERVAAARALPRAQGGESQRGREREEREKGSGERNKSQRFDLVQTQDFQLKLEKF